jgi:hypothetical protein
MAGIREIIDATFGVALEGDKKQQKRATAKDLKDGLFVLTTQRLLFLAGQELDKAKTLQEKRV